MALNLFFKALSFSGTNGHIVLELHLIRAAPP
jgi:hypothetical protein